MVHTCNSGILLDIWRCAQVFKSSSQCQSGGVHQQLLASSIGHWNWNSFRIRIFTGFQLGFVCGTIWTVGSACSCHYHSCHRFYMPPSIGWFIHRWKYKHRKPAFHKTTRYTTYKQFTYLDLPMLAATTLLRMPTMALVGRGHGSALGSACRLGRWAGL